MNKQAYSLRNKYFITKDMCVIHVAIILDYLHQQQIFLSELHNTYKGNYIIWAELGAEEVPEEKYV
jgi:hypothetical protein